MPWLTRTAAWRLAAMLAAMSPANIHAARAGVTLGGKPPMPLVWRVPEQLYWMGCLAVVAMAG